MEQSDNNGATTHSPAYALDRHIPSKPVLAMQMHV